MHRAKAFFFACAGIFLLALAYHLGAQSATAQSGDSIEGASCAGGSYTACINRVVWLVDGTGLHCIATPVPGTSSVLSTAGGGSGAVTSALVILSNGDCYWWPSNGTAWVLYGSFAGAGSPVPAQRLSIGQLKAKYR
jgi:hypothetical protein